MLYNVLDVFPVGENTSVTIEGNGEGLKNNIDITASDGSKHKLLSVGMTSGHSVEDVKKTTTVLVKGKFNSPTLQA